MTVEVTTMSVTCVACGKHIEWLTAVFSFYINIDLVAKEITSVGLYYVLY